MYILVRDDIPLGLAMVAVAHASLAGYLKFRDTPEVAEWLRGRFSKAVCAVDARQFDSAKAEPDHLVLTESALDNREVAIVFKPRQEWPKMFKFLKLYREPPRMRDLGDETLASAPRLAQFAQGKGFRRLVTTVKGLLPVEQRDSFDTEGWLRRWLLEEHRALGYRRPLDVLDEPGGGVDKLERLLLAAAFGVYQ